MKKIVLVLIAINFSIISTNAQIFKKKSSKKEDIVPTYLFNTDYNLIDRDFEFFKVFANEKGQWRESSMRELDSEINGYDMMYILDEDFRISNIMYNYMYTYFFLDHKIIQIKVISNYQNQFNEKLIEMGYENVRSEKNGDNTTIKYVNPSQPGSIQVRYKTSSYSSNPKDIRITIY